MTDIVRLNKSNVKSASEALTLAFQDYPLLQYAFPDRAERGKMVPYYCQMVLYYGIRYGEVYTTSPDYEGVAAWVTSEYFPMTFWKLIRAVPLSVIGAFSKGVSSRMKHPGKYIDAMHRRHAPFQHWFLLIIGVEP